MTPNPIRFGTDGWRAVVADDFTYANVRAVAQGVAAYLGSEPRPVVVGHDSRYCAEQFAREVARVLVANGHRVILLDRVTPTPAVSWTITQQHAAGGVMVTASHNSAEFNGIKYKPDFGGSAPPEVVAEIELHTAHALEAGVTEMTYDEAVATGRLQLIDPLPDYFLQLGRMVNLDALRSPWPARAARGHVRRRRGAHRPSARRRVDHRRGAARRAQPGLRWDASGADRSLHAGGDASAWHPERSTSASRNDGDADRVGIIDETGRFINQLQVFALLDASTSSSSAACAATIVRPSITTCDGRRAGSSSSACTVYELPVGFKYIAPKMIETRRAARRRGVGWLRVPGPHPRAGRHPGRPDVRLR